MRRALCLTALLLGFLFGQAGPVIHADDEIPEPPKEWWTMLTGDEKATFEMTTASVTMKVVMSIDKVEGSKITYTTTTYMGPTAMPQTQTVDVRPKEGEAEEGVAPGAKVTKGEEETMEVGDRTLDVTLYTIESAGATMKVWHCRGLPPIFSGGNAKMVTDAQGQKTTMTLKKYEGPLLGEESSEEEPEDDAEKKEGDSE